MILFLGSAVLIARFRRAVPHSGAFEATSCWSEAANRVHRSRCLVVLSERFDSRTHAELTRLQQHAPGVPVVLVIPLDTQARRLGDLSVPEVVWIHEGQAAARAAISRAIRAGVVRRLATDVREARHLPLGLRTALAESIDGHRTVRSVKGLAGLAGCDRSTLWRQWTNAAGTDAVSLSDVVAWVTLLREGVSPAPGGGRAPPGFADPGWGDRTLRRTARKLGIPGAVLRAGPEALLAHPVSQRMLKVFVGPECNTSVSDATPR